MEKEENNSIPYLDMRLHRENDKILTDWYTKSIASGRIINFHSTQPMTQKINTALNMINKVFQLSDNKFLSKNINKIKEMLVKNSFPKKIINNLIQKATNKNTGEISNTQNNNTSGSTKFYSLAFIPKLTENIQMREIIKDNNIILAHRANKTTNSLFTQTKTKIETRDKSNVVYEIKCIGNDQEKCGKIYIGTTKRSLGTRIDEHEADIKKQKLTTGLSQHCFDKKHTVDLKNVRILEVEKKVGKRYTLESLRIQQKADQVMNKKEDIDGANSNYIIAII